MVFGTGAAFAASDPGHVFVSPASATAGMTVHVSGTCPDGADAVISVTSPAFEGGKAKLTKADPMAFTADTTIQSQAAAKSQPITVECSVAHAVVPIKGQINVLANHGGGGSNTPNNQGGQVVIPKAAPETGGLTPASPSSDLPLELAAAGLVLAAGGGVVYAARRRAKAN